MLPDMAAHIDAIRKKFPVCIWIIVFAAFFIPGMFGREAHGSDWRLIGKDANDCQWFYDGASVRHLPERKTLVWLKRMVSDVQRATAVREREKSGRPIEGYDRWAYELGLMELDCRAVTIRQLSVSDYDKSGKFLRVRKIGKNLGAITPDSIGEAVYKTVCGSPVGDIEKVIPEFPLRPGR